MDMLIQCLSAFVGSLGFSFVFRINKNKKNAILGALGGTIGWATYLAFNSFNSIMLQSFIAMIVVALFSEIMARVNKVPATVFIIIGCFPLVPGKFIYLSMSHWIDGNIELFSDALFTTFTTAGALALAILIVSTIFKVNKTVKEKYRL